MNIKSKENSGEANRFGMKRPHDQKRKHRRAGQEDALTLFHLQLQVLQGTGERGSQLLQFFTRVCEKAQGRFDSRTPHTTSSKCSPIPH